MSPSATFFYSNCESERNKLYKKKLGTLPVQIDAMAIAEGLFEMFTDEEKTALRFGMLAAEKMECLKNNFEYYFRSLGSPWSNTGDVMLAVMHKDSKYPRHIEFSMKKLVAEAVHEVTLCLLEIGDLVV